MIPQQQEHLQHIKALPVHLLHLPPTPLTLECIPINPNLIISSTSFPHQDTSVARMQERESAEFS